MDKLADKLADKDTTDNLADKPIQDPIELQICLEKEKQKCLKGLQTYYQKYGCAQIAVLRSYLTTLLEKDPIDKEQIQTQLDLLDDYS